MVGTTQKLVVYPNPVSNGRLTIDILTNSALSAEAYNPAGIRVLFHNFKKEKELNVNGLRIGMYVLRIVSEGETRAGTLVVESG